MNGQRDMFDYVLFSVSSAIYNLPVIIYCSILNRVSIFSLFGSQTLVQNSTRKFFFHFNQLFNFISMSKLSLRVHREHFKHSLQQAISFPSSGSHLTTLQNILDKIYPKKLINLILKELKTADCQFYSHKFISAV